MVDSVPYMNGHRPDPPYPIIQYPILNGNTIDACTTDNDTNYNVLITDLIKYPASQFPFTSDNNDHVICDRTLSVKYDLFHGSDDKIEEEEGFSQSGVQEKATTRMERASSNPPTSQYKQYNYNSLKTPSFDALKKAVSQLYRLDDFKTTPLAQGFFSSVYLAHHEAHDETLVLKRNTQEHNQPNVLREIELLNLLANDSKAAQHIVKFRGVAVESGRLHILTEYCTGGSLESLILSQPFQILSWKLRVNMAWEIARGMAYVNSLGYMHRDLTARNILIKCDARNRYHAVVGDFGLACLRPGMGLKRTETVGTPYYMAPEMIIQSQYDHKADVFSYGIILCQLIARIDADPDIMPRTKCFGLDYPRFAEKCDENTPTDLLTLAFTCCVYDSGSRPTFEEASNSAFSATLRKRRCNKWNTQICNTDAASLEKPHVRRSSSEAALCSPQNLNTNFEFEGTESIRKMTDLALSIAQNDRFYQPGDLTNPFDRHERLKDVKKVLFSKKVSRNETGDVAAPSTSAYEQLRTSQISLVDEPFAQEFVDINEDFLSEMPLESTPEKLLRSLQIRRTHSLPASPSNPFKKFVRRKRAAAEIAETFHEKDERRARLSCSKNGVHSEFGNNTYSFDEVSVVEDKPEKIMDQKLICNNANKKYNYCNII